MRLTNTTLVLLICLLSCYSSATVLSTATRLISLNDKALAISFKKNEASHRMLVSASESSGLSGMIEATRMMRAVLSSESRSNPTDPKDIYLGQLWNLAEIGIGSDPLDLMATFSEFSPVSRSGGSLDRAFEVLQRNKSLNEDLKKVLLMVLKILNESSEIINSFTELGLIEKLQEIKEEIEELGQSE
ncbi:hypothetical protein [Endozoicomonas sp. 8E]|uniref:hypothetical protein n=1 Tax=Endozoicomonas sp. 8E TaxID=3035692 RepID=UPI0029392011|nr:hypothetical protein [Endozoicomonas sp. 8E]WOG26056.1 hypothetical protein P6910_15920 [Endozoicomonas sp. 8E]